MAYFDSSSWYCLVDRACGDTARDSAGRLLEHAEQTELLFTTGQRSLAGPDNSRNMARPWRLASKIALTPFSEKGVP